MIPEGTGAERGRGARRRALGVACAALPLAFGGLAAGCDRTDCHGLPGAATERLACVETLSVEPLVVAVELATDGDRLAFDANRVEVPLGAEVRLTFRNTATEPMFHNWVLVVPGSEEGVARAGTLAGFPSGWVPSSPDVLASTAALRPGEADTIVFVADRPGELPYLCTIPGHAKAMRGTLVVLGGDEALAAAERALARLGARSPRRRR